MIRNKLFLTAVMLLIPGVIFAGTVFEDEKKTSDPFIGERGGFNSLFVNPAGAAGQSGFELSVTGGIRTTTNDITLIVGMADMAVSMAENGGTLDVSTVEDVTQTLSDLYDSGAIDAALLDSIFGGTPLDSLAVDWSDPAAVLAAAQSLDPVTDVPVIENNVNTIIDGTNAAFYGALPGTIRAEAVAGFKTGFLIGGFGLGIYDQATGVAYMDPVTQEYGLETIYNELGVIAGGGFNLFDGKLALGFAANYGVLMKNTAPVAFTSFDTLINTSLNYGYTWGLDLGAVWRPTPSLGIGVVLNDVAGYTQADVPYTTAGITGFFNDQAYLMQQFDYEFTMDVDAGITWQPDWRLVRPKFSLDLYNVVGYARDIVDNGDDFEAAMYRSLEHIRVGANFTFFDFLKVGGQYYNHYVSAGIGLDLLFLEFYGEVKVHDQALIAQSLGDVPIGGDFLVRIHF